MFLKLYYIYLCMCAHTYEYAEQACTHTHVFICGSRHAHTRMYMWDRHVHGMCTEAEGPLAVVGSLLGP